MWHTQAFSVPPLPLFRTLRINPLKPGTTAGTLQAEKHRCRLLQVASGRVLGWRPSGCPRALPGHAEKRHAHSGGSVCHGYLPKLALKLAQRLPRAGCWHSAAPLAEESLALRRVQTVCQQILIPEILIQSGEVAEFSELGH